MIFYLLRHGAYNEGEETLNQRGLNQTQAAFAYLSKKVSDPAIISSKGPRSKQTAFLLVEQFGSVPNIVDWLDKSKENENLDIGLLLNKIQKQALNIPILVTNGEFIHQFVKQFSEERKVTNPLKPLVKGEMMLCEVHDNNLQVEYF